MPMSTLMAIWPLSTAGGRGSPSSTAMLAYQWFRAASHAYAGYAPDPSQRLAHAYGAAHLPGNKSCLPSVRMTHPRPIIGAERRPDTALLEPGTS